MLRLTEPRSFLNQGTAEKAGTARAALRRPRRVHRRNRPPNARTFPSVRQTLAAHSPQILSLRLRASAVKILESSRCGAKNNPEDGKGMNDKAARAKQRQTREIDAKLKNF